MHFSTHLWLKRASIKEVVLFIQFSSSPFLRFINMFFLGNSNIILVDLDSKRFECIHHWSLYGSLWSSGYDSWIFVIEDTSWNARQFTTNCSYVVMFVSLLYAIGTMQYGPMWGTWYGSVTLSHTHTHTHAHTHLHTYGHTYVHDIYHTFDIYRQWHMLCYNKKRIHLPEIMRVRICIAYRANRVKKVE